MTVGRAGSAIGQRLTANVLVILLFFALRIPLLIVRQPFFDELFTRWIAARSFAGILGALRYDSGPPLYYCIVHLMGDPPVAVLRCVSLLFATIALAALLARKQIVAAALLAVFPPAVLFAVDSRAYALCAMFVTMGVLLIDDRPYLSALSFVAAAYSHYYGALLIPLSLGRGWRGAPGERRPSIKTFALSVLLFAPGVWLALHQPRESVAWIGPFPQWPEALFARPPIWLLILAAVLIVAAGYRLNRFAAMTLIPLAIALVLRIYFPLRFESVIAAPFVLWIAASARKVLIAPLLAIGVAISAIGIIDHAQRPVDDYRAAAEFVRSAPGTVVASGYLYLETISLRPAVAFPPEQAVHPGWRATATSASGLPRGPFIWIGERYAPELALIERSRRTTPLFVYGRAAVVRVN
ncbi:MAG TPA: hypothetical protein VI391_09985 [Thermoanaerobaculia bacterium]